MLCPYVEAAAEHAQNSHLRFCVTNLHIKMWPWLQPQMRSAHLSYNEKIWDLRIDAFLPKALRQPQPRDFPRACAKYSNQGRM